jgi:AcrR family transcriptional regulator
VSYPSIDPNYIRINMGHVTGEVKRHRYDAARRAAQSTRTRQRIIEAAHALFVQRGYRATTLAAIASSADVSVDTIYELVGRKSALLRELVEQAISGTDRAVVAEERGYVRAVIAEPDPAAKLAIYAGAVREIHERMAPLFLALREASSTEPEAEAVWKRIGERRATNMRKLARDLRQASGLRADLSIPDAGDILWATNSPELYVLLTVERGWSPDRYQRWLTDTWHRLLLP